MAKEIDVWRPCDYDVKENDKFEVIKTNKQDLGSGDILTTFTLRKVRKHE